MFLTGLSGSVLALASAVVYGSGDFFGGLASRRLHPFQVLTVSSFVGFLVMLGLAVVQGETWPSVEDLIWAGLAGSLGMLGLAALYRGLAMGESAIVSPTSGVVGAALPVLVGIITQGFPSSIQLAGFAAAIPGIWLVTLQPGASRQRIRTGFWLGCLAGVGFGLFFVLIAQVDHRAIFAPLAFLKLVALILAGAVYFIKRHTLPYLRTNFKAVWIAVLAGLFDPLANALYLAATRLARLDVAVVLTSLFPAVTVLLSWVVLKERISTLQWLGVILCLLAIVLITVSSQ